MLGGSVVSGSGTSEFGKSFVKLNNKNKTIKLLEGLFLEEGKEEVEGEVLTVEAPSQGLELAGSLEDDF